MSFLKSVLLAFSMFSTVPMPRVEWNQKNMRYMMCAFPLVGVFTAVLCAAWFLFGIQILYIWNKNIPLPLFALVFTLIPVLISGGIHLDGFMDTCDALASHASQEKKLEILKDSHSGAFAVLGCVLYFLSFYVLSYCLYTRFFGADSSHRFVNLFARFYNSLPALSLFVLSRLLSAFAVAAFPIAKNSGLVHTFASSSAKRFTAIWCYVWFFLVSIALIFFFRFLGIALVASSLAAFCFYYITAIKNFGGITGDTAGWFVQICELVGLAVFVIFSFL